MAINAFKSVFVVDYCGKKNLTQAVFMDVLGHENMVFKAKPDESSLEENKGFVSPSYILLGIGSETAMLTEESGGNIFFTLRVAEKKVPASRVKKAVREKVKAIAQERKIPINELMKDKQFKEELKAIEDEEKYALLSKTMYSEREINAFYNKDKKRLFVEGTQADAEKLITTFDGTDIAFDIKNKTFKQNISPTLTDWVTYLNNMPKKLDIEEAGFVSMSVIDDKDDKSKATYSKQNILSDEIKTSISNNKKVVEMSLEFDGKISLTLNRDCYIKSIKPISKTKDEEKDEEKIDESIATWTKNADIIVSLVDYIKKAIKNNSPQPSSSFEAEPVQDNETENADDKVAEDDLTATITVGESKIIEDGLEEAKSMVDAKDFGLNNIGGVI